MVSELQGIILSEGVKVQIQSTSGVSQTTTALFGKATRQFFSALALETTRKAQFVPEVDLANGYIVHILASGETYIVVSNFEQLVDNQVASVVVQMYRCNSKIDIKTVGTTADENGDITTADITKYSDVTVNIEAVTSDLRQYQPGLLAETTYLIYAPSVEVSILDTISADINSRKVPLKVVGTDYVSFPGLVLIQVKTETRA